MFFYFVFQCLISQKFHETIFGLITLTRRTKTAKIKKAHITQEHIDVMARQCAAKVISAFLIFAVLVLRVNDSRPYTPIQTVKFFSLIGQEIRIQSSHFNW